MNKLTFALILGTAVAFSAGFAADKEKSDRATAKESTFIKKAADGGMTEVELGKIGKEWSKGRHQKLRQSDGQRPRESQ